MKKKSLLLLFVMCMLALVACNEDKNKLQKAEVNILQEMGEANSRETLTAKYEKIAFRKTYTYPDEIISEYCYQDSERYVEENDYVIYIDEKGDVYGFDNEEKLAFRYLFIGDSYKEFYDESDLAGYFYDGDIEVIVSQEEKDGIITLNTENKDEETIKWYEEEYLFKEETINKIAYTYKVDAENYELYSTTVSLVMSDGEKRDIVTSERVENPETYVVDEKLKMAVFDGDRRTVTVTESAKTEKEKVYSQTISKGNYIQLAFPSDGNQVLYTDIDCTIEYIGNEDKNADINLYYKN